MERIIKHYDELKTIEMTKVDREPTMLSIETYECKLNNGKTIYRDKLLKNNKEGGASIVFSITKDYKVLVTTESRNFIEKTVDTGFPAGYIEEGENPLDAAKRELEEETGYTSNKFICLDEYNQDQGISGALNHYYVALDCEKIGEQKLDEGENLKFDLVTFDELKELYEKGFIKGLNSAFLIEKALRVLGDDFMKKEYYKKLADDIIEFIRNYYQENNLKGAVIGISGGKDSAVVAGLFVKALGKENVTGIWMPCHSNEEDKNNAYELSKHFGFELKEYDLTNIYDSYVKQIELENNEVNDDILKDSNINLKPRLRMSTLYYYAAMLSKIKGGTYIVPGTSNKSEVFVCYFTKGGDNVADIQVIKDLYVSEVIGVGEVIGVPYHIVHKTPDDGLSGQSDEEKLQVKYSEIEDVCENEGRNTNKITRERILSLHNNNMHKLITPTFLKK